MTNWPDDRVAMLRQLRATMSATEAAREIGVTRSAVLGKEKRLRDAGTPVVIDRARRHMPRETSRTALALDIIFARSQR